MKTKRHSNRGSLLFLIASIALVLIFSVSSCKKTETDNKVMQAYDLRMNGDADSAMNMLDMVLEEDSSNAEALFELSRTMHHIGLGNPASLFKGLVDIQAMINLAVENDTDNVIYTFYQGYLTYLGAYISFMQQQPDAADKVGKVVDVYKKVLELKPDYSEAELYLVEILSVPPEMGGDSLLAIEYAADLVEKDPIAGAQAQELLLPDDADRIAFWKEVLDANPGNPEVMERLGKTYLYNDDVEEGEKYLEEAIKMDPKKSIVLLDLARYYLMASRGDSVKAEIFMPQAEVAVKRYLETKPPAPLEAYAYSVMAYVKDGLREFDEVAALREKAIEIDPNVSKAFGIPPMILFTKPDEISHYYGYFSRPF